MAIPFTQYVRPNGRRELVEIERPSDVEAMAQEIRAKGYRFECEQLRTGEVSLTVVSLHEDEGDIDIVMVAGDVQEAVDILVRRVYEKVK